MKCTLNGSNARILAKAVQSLSKFGSDLFVEAYSHGLQFRTINSNRSAVGSVIFRRDFFESYQLRPDGESYCKISMKTCLTAFRNMKQVEVCEISILTKQQKLQIDLKCHLETVKRAVIAVVDDENITADVSPDEAPNVISGTYKVFYEILNNFNGAEEEITLEAQFDALSAKNYVDGAHVNEQFMRSQLKLSASEFEKYQIKHEAAITFCLKEFRAFILFAELLNMPIYLNFDKSGRPLFINLKKQMEIECTLIMSTLSPDDVTYYDRCCPSDISEISENPIQSKHKRKLNNPTNNNSKIRRSKDKSSNKQDSELQSVNIPRDYVLGCDQRSFTAQSDIGNNKALSMTEEECVQQSPPITAKRAQLRSIFSRCFESTYAPEEPLPNSQIYVPNSDSED